MKEEDYILTKIGKENPFQTPEGYFDNLTSEVMNRLPEKDFTQQETVVVSTWEKVKPLLYMAALFAGAAFILRTGVFTMQKENTNYLAEDEEEMEREYIDRIVNEALLDDYSFYELLSEADYSY